MSVKVLKGVSSSSSSSFLAPELVAGSHMGRCIGVSSSCAAAALGPLLGETIGGLLLVAFGEAIGELLLAAFNPALCV